MNLTEHICHMAARYDAVAFDVFDTLIKRDTACLLYTSPSPRD